MYLDGPGGYRVIDDFANTEITGDCLFIYSFEGEFLLKATPKLLIGGGSADLKMSLLHYRLTVPTVVELPDPKFSDGLLTLHLEFPNETKTYEFKGWYYADDEETVEKFHYCIVTVLASDEKSPFPDVKPDHLYHNQVLWAAFSGVTDGLADGTFRPYDICTRAQVLTFL